MKTFGRFGNILYYAILSIPWVSVLVMWGFYFTAAVIIGRFPGYVGPDATQIFGEGYSWISSSLLILYFASWLIPALFVLQCILQPFRWRSMIVSLVGFLLNLYTIFIVGFWLFD